jgi:large subunit ribosomal protein L29
VIRQSRGAGTLKLKEFRELNDSEMKEQLDETHQELFNLRFRLATKQLVNHREVRRVKKKIARLKTLMRERELGIR